MTVNWVIKLIELAVAVMEATNAGRRHQRLDGHLVHRQVEQMDYCEEEKEEGVRWAAHLLYSVAVV